MRFVKLEAWRLVWSGLAVCCTLVIAISVPAWAWQERGRTRSQGLFLVMDSYQVVAVAGLLASVAIGLSSVSAHTAIRRLDYIATHGFSLAARAGGAVLSPALAAFVVALIGQFLGWAAATVVVRQGISPIPGGAGVRRWQEFLEPGVAGVPVWALDIVTIVVFAVVCGAAAALASCLLMVTGSTWGTGLLMVVGSTVGASLLRGALPWDVRPVSLDERLSDRQHWLIGLVYAVVLTASALVAWWAYAKRRGER